MWFYSGLSTPLSFVSDLRAWAEASYLRSRARDPAIFRRPSAESDDRVTHPPSGIKYSMSRTDGEIIR